MILNFIFSLPPEVKGAGVSGAAAKREETKTLADLRVGESGVVSAVEGRDDSLVRLMEMGLIKHTRVKLVRVAPLGDPLYLELRGYCLSIRKSEARRIRVDAVSNGHAPKR